MSRPQQRHGDLTGTAAPHARPRAGLLVLLLGGGLFTALFAFPPHQVRVQPFTFVTPGDNRPEYRSAGRQLLGAPPDGWNSEYRDRGLRIDLPRHALELAGVALLTGTAFAAARLYLERGSG